MCSSYDLCQIFHAVPFHHGRQIFDNGLAGIRLHKVRRAHADGGSAGGVGRLYHGPAAGGQNQAGIVVAHEGVGGLQGGGGDAGNAPRRGSRPLRRPAHHVHRLQDAVYRAGVGREDNGVARLHTDHGFIDHGGGGVGGGHQPRHNAHWHADINGALLPVFRQDAVGLFVSDGLIEGGGGKAVFKLFILFFCRSPSPPPPCRPAAGRVPRRLRRWPPLFCPAAPGSYPPASSVPAWPAGAALLSLEWIAILVQMVHLVLSGGGRTQFAPASPGRLRRPPYVFPPPSSDLPLGRAATAFTASAKAAQAALHALWVPVRSPPPKLVSLGGSRGRPAPRRRL